MTKLAHVCKSKHMHTNDMTTSMIVAEYGVSPRTVHRKVAAGKLRPKSKFPGATGGYVFRRGDVEKLFARGVA